MVSTPRRVARLGIALVLAALLIASLSTIPALAHPGRTSSDGCHYCRTNCDRWGVPWNQRHCHGTPSSRVAPSISRSPPQPRPQRQVTWWDEWGAIALAAAGGAALWYGVRRQRPRPQEPEPSPPPPATQQTRPGKTPTPRSSPGHCPCGGRFVLRNGRYGRFYGCTRYPRCRRTRNY